MGNCSNRPEVIAATNTSAEWYKNVSEYSVKKYTETSEYLGPRLAQAQSDYAPQLDQAKMNYDIARMYANGWVNESVTDESQIKFVTEFEKMLPLRNISLTEFERRVKKLVTPAMNDCATIRMIQECFKDHWAFLDIEDRESLTHEVMFDEIFIVQNDQDDDQEIDYLDTELSVPFLMLLGLLYCRSNRKQRAEKFYELVEIELTETLQVNDQELRRYIPYMYEISYKLMFRLYMRHRDQTPENNQPDIGENVSVYVPTDFEVDSGLIEKYKKRFVQDLFMSKTRLDKKEMETKLSEKIYYLLQPHDIRVRAYDSYQNTSE